MRVFGWMALAAFWATAFVAAATAGDRPHVYLVVVDGLDAALVTPERMPRLFGLLADEPAHTTLFRDGQGVMPARTNPNHATLFTGVYPDAHGITGNAYWSRTAGAPGGPLDDASLLEVDTLFTRAEDKDPEFVTMGFFGKPKLARLFAAAPAQRGPDVGWSGADADAAGWNPFVPGTASDATTIAALSAATAEREPDLVFVNLPDVDLTAHRLGRDDPAVGAAVTAADAALGRLIDDLHTRGRWERSVLIVTGDHGFTTIASSIDGVAPDLRLQPELDRAGVTGVHLVADGAIEHVYADGVAADAPGPGDAAELLARVAQIARGTPGVAEVLGRQALPDVPALTAVHPDWHLDHQRSGDLLLLSVPGFRFVDAWVPSAMATMRGDHGGPADRRVPLLVTGGAPQIRAAGAQAASPGSVDVAPTIAALLGLPAPRRLDGRPLAAGAAGQPVTSVLAPEAPPATDRTAGSSG